MKKFFKLNFDTYVSLKISLIYAIFSSLWILSSDQLVYFLVKDPEALTRIQTLKGWCFILITALIIFSLLRREIRKYIQTEARLHYSKERYQVLISNASDLRYQTDLDGNITFVSPSVHNLFGYMEKEVMGKNIAEKFYVRPEERTDLLIQLQEKGHVENFKIQIKRKDGSFCWASTNAHFLKDQDGIIIGIEGVTKDVTERELAMIALQESEKRFKTIFKNATDGILLADMNRNFFDTNKKMSKMLGYSQNEIRTLSVSDIHPEKELSHVLRLFKKMETGEISVAIDVPVKMKNGNIFYADISSTPIEIAGQNYIMGTFRDTSEFKKLETRLQQAQKMETIGTLAGGIAHDFNNILFPILGFTEILLENDSLDRSSRASLNTIYSGALRAKDLVKQILTFSRQDKNELKLIKIKPIVKEALKLIRSSIPTTIKIKQDIQEDCGIIKADPTQIHQIIMNLSTNAYHAMEGIGGELKVVLKKVKISEDDTVISGIKPNTYTCLTVSDTGKGMDKNLINKIFNPFFTTKEKGKGTGMGLSVVHGIVKSVNGEIQVSSVPEKGTKISIYIPEEMNSYEKDYCPKKESIPCGTERILLVDDEKDIITMEKQMLEHLGYQVTSRTSSIEALEAFRVNHNKFDMVITDMTMPNMTGDKLSLELIKIRPDIPILICTGFSELISDEKAASIGIKGLIFKPVARRDLAIKIHEVLGHK